MEKSPVDQQPQSISVDIPVEILGELKWLAEKMDVPASVALRQAIATQAFILETQKSGKKILMQGDNGTTYQLEFETIKPR